ncbi:MAG: AAA family ATPase [Betaproteobacteria bacterium]|nr:MAG: AAA family ATPase [Betaproteobacteria bacterium]
MRVLAAYNIKGGTGKTTTAVNLAYLSAYYGARTLVWDLDPQGAATFYFRIPERRGGGKRHIRGKQDLDSLIRGTDFEMLDLLRASFSYRNLDQTLAATKKPLKRFAQLIQPLASDYDCLIFDCPPGINLVSESIFFASDALLVPTIPTTLSLRCLDLLIEHLERNGPRSLRVFPFFSMVDSRKSLHKNICAAPPVKGARFLKTRIPYASVVEQMGVQRAPLPVFAARTPIDYAYHALWNEIETELDSPARGTGLTPATQRLALEIR